MAIQSASHAINNHLRPATDIYFNPDGNCAISCWIKPDASSLNKRREIAGQRGTASTGWKFFVENTNDYLAMSYIGRAQYNHSNAIDESGVWSHVVFNQVSSTSLILYENGVAQGSAITTGTHITNSSVNLQVFGQNKAGTSLSSFLGSLAEFALYDTRLTTGEITDLYNDAKTPADCADCAFWWRMNSLSELEEEIVGGGTYDLVEHASSALSNDTDHPVTIGGGGSVVPIILQQMGR